MSPTKRITSFDVAKLAGVSRTTVSFVLNDTPDVSISEATRARVLEAARQLNYHPNAAGRKLASGRSSALGLVVRQNPQQVFADAFLMQVALGIEQAAAECGFHVLIKPLEPGGQDGYTRLIHENYVDGILLSGPRQDDPELLELHRENFPVVLLGQLPGSGIPFVDINAVDGAAAAVRHLVELGHTRIALITNAPLVYTSAQQRRAGYEQALRNAGLPLRAEYMRAGDFTPSSGLEAMNALLALPVRPTAVFVASDVVAMGAIQAARRAGLEIPRDLALVGFDDIPLAEYFNPPLTTIRLPAFDLGRSAAKRLIGIIRGETDLPRGILLDTELIVRASSRM